MKGGILMALHYDSPRHTTDIDFSTPNAFDEDVEKLVLKELSSSLAQAPEQLDYDIDCRIQGHKVKPKRDKTYITIEMSIGYATKGSPQHKRLVAGNSPSALSVEYSFLESIPEVEAVELSDDGTLRVYALSTLVAEKYRSLLQQPIRDRYRRQDVYDINHLLRERPELLGDEQKASVLSDLMVKCADRNIVATIDSMNNPEVKARAAKDFDTLATELAAGTLPAFDEIFDNVLAYYRSLPWVGLPNLPLSQNAV